MLSWLPVRFVCVEKLAPEDSKGLVMEADVSIGEKLGPRLFGGANNDEAGLLFSLSWKV